MLKIKKLCSILVAALLLACGLTGCDSTPVQACILDSQAYTTEEATDNASQPSTLIPGKEVFASVHFIESPRGMEYTGVWSLDGVEIKSETKATVNDAHGVLVYSLEADKATSGTLTFSICYKGKTAVKAEVTLKS